MWCLTWVKGTWPFSNLSNYAGISLKLPLRLPFWGWHFFTHSTVGRAALRAQLSGTVSKTVVALMASVGSNPTLSAERITFRASSPAATLGERMSKC
jgi:hypothetical protein